MKNYYLIFVILLLTNYLKAQSLEEKLKNHVYYLASDSLKGRDTGTPEIDSAANYIANYLKSNNIKPANKGSYYQDFYLYSFSMGNNYFYDDSLKKRKFYFIPIANKPFTDSLNFKIDYIGYDNKSNLQIDSGAMPLFLIDYYRNPENTAHDISKIAQKYKLNKILFSIPPDSKPSKRIMYSWYYLNQYKTKSKFDKSIQKNAYLHQVAKYLPDSLIAVFVPYYSYYKIFMDKKEKGEKMKYFSAKKIDAKMKTAKTESERSYIFNYAPEIDSMRVRNVMGVIEGNKRADEYIIVCAHYDHVGKNYNGMCVGADDNASGTASIMEQAAMFSKSDNKPERTLVFIFFSAEEMGLYGSMHYADNPVFPLNKTIAVVNLDMVGRSDDHDNYFVHAKFHGPNDRKLKKIAKNTSKDFADFQLDLHPGLGPRIVYTFASDHFSFTRKKVRNIVLFTDNHSDYHTPADTPDKIDYLNMEKINKFLFKLLQNISNSNKFNN